MMNLNKLVALLLLMTFGQINAQGRVSARAYEADLGVLRDISGRSVNKVDEIGMYLFDTWESDAIFHMNNNKNLKAKNINFNIQKDQFECKFAKDSLYIFDHNFDFSLINAKKFKRYFIGSSPSYAEVLFEGENTTFIKKYNYKVLQSSPDPLMIRKDVNKVFVIHTYYLIDNKTEALQLVKLKKSSFSKLFSEKKNDMNAFVKRNKLSYKEERDIFEMLQYRATL